MPHPSQHRSVAGEFTSRGELICGTPGCGKTLGIGTREGETVLRCPGCKADNVFSIPLYLARALENSTAAQVKLAEAFALIAAMTAAGTVPKHV